jgi:hypothetical protein
MFQYLFNFFYKNVKQLKFENIPGLEENAVHAKKYKMCKLDLEVSIKLYHSKEEMKSVTSASDFLKCTLTGTFFLC